MVNNIAAAKSKTNSHGLSVVRMPSLPTTLELAVVVTVMLTNELEVTEVGLKVHDESDGSPLQLNVIVPAAGLATPT